MSDSTQTIKPLAYFELRQLGFFSRSMQIVLICLVFIFRVLQSHTELTQKGSLWGYPAQDLFVLAPLYEEVLFRGLILGGLQKYYSPKLSLIISSFLFGCWHLKNMLYFGWGFGLIHQVLYATLFIGPLLGFITLKTKSIWPGVILHYLNNIWAPYSWYVLELFIS